MKKLKPYMKMDEKIIKFDDNEFDNFINIKALF